MAGRRRADDAPGPGLSERQQRILDFIQAYVERFGVSPSYREIGNAVGLKAISAVKYQVGQLEEKDTWPGVTGCRARSWRNPGACGASRQSSTEYRPIPVRET